MVFALLSLAIFVGIGGENLSQWHLIGPVAPGQDLSTHNSSGCAIGIEVGKCCIENWLSAIHL